MADREKNIIILSIVICATLIICGIMFWPTLYRYEKTNKYLTRINRVTGYTEILSPRGGWLPVDEKESIKNVRLDAIQIQLITGKANITNYGYFEANIYNGSYFTICKIKVNIVAKDNDGSIRWSRSFITYIKGIYIISPQTTGEIIAKLIDADNIASFNWQIEEVMGYKASEK